MTSVAAELARGGNDVTLMGAGPSIVGRPYRYIQIRAVPRECFERLPAFPPFRSDTVYEEASFAAGLLARYRPSAFDVTVTCSFPFINWALRRPPLRGRRPSHVFVTQNGDWPARSQQSEFRFFGCDGLVCINPDYYRDNKDRWRATLIPNGLAIDHFHAGPFDRAQFDLPSDQPVVLMVSALIESKRVAEGIKAVSLLDGVHLVCAGDGPLRAEIDALAARWLPGRYTRLTVDAAAMPDLYRTADAFLHLSLNESFGNVYIEAMASGLPVVAPDLPRTRWIVGDDEFLCDTADCTALVGTLAAALAAPRRDAAYSQSKVERFAWPLIARHYRQFFHDVRSAA